MYGFNTNNQIMPQANTMFANAMALMGQNNQMTGLNNQMAMIGQNNQMAGSNNQMMNFGIPAPQIGRLHAL